MQEPKEDKDQEYCQTVNRVMNGNTSSPEPSGSEALSQDQLYNLLNFKFIFIFFLKKKTKLDFLIKI